MARKMKDSGIEWIGEIPEGWEVVPVKRLCTMQAGKNLTSEQIAPEGTYPVYGGNGIRGFFSDYNCDGQFLTVGRQGALCGNVHKINGKVWATEHAVITTPSSYTILDFLYYLLIGMDLNQYVSSTAAQPGLAVGTLLNLKTCYPCSKLEQTQISNYLNAKCAEIDIMLSKTRSSIEDYKKLKQAVITQAVTKGVRGEREMKDSGVDWISEIPANWTVKRGKQLFSETNERSETGSEELLTVSHITGVTPRSQKNVNMFMSESLVGYKICHNGDLAANTMWMWQGAIGVSKFHGVISPSYNTYRQKTNDYYFEYLDYLLRIRPLIDAYTIHSTGITLSRLRLYPDSFLSLYFIVRQTLQRAKTDRETGC